MEEHEDEQEHEEEHEHEEGGMPFRVKRTGPRPPASLLPLPIKPTCLFVPSRTQFATADTAAVPLRDGRIRKRARTQISAAAAANSDDDSGDEDYGGGSAKRGSAKKARTPSSSARYRPAHAHVSHPHTAATALTRAGRGTNRGLRGSGKRRRSRAADDSDSDDAAPGGSGDDDDDDDDERFVYKYDADGFRDELDRAELLAMTEKEREQILAARLEEREHEEERYVC